MDTERLKKLLKVALYYITVPKCVCCEEILDIDDVALCKRCIKEYENSKLSDCSLCGKVLNECTCVNDYLERHMVHKLIKVFRYKPSVDFNEKIASNELIYHIKREKRNDLLHFMAKEIVLAIRNSLTLDDNYIISSVPRKRSRVIKYGLDHSAEIAKTVAKLLGIEYVSLLVSNSKQPQKKTHGNMRLQNAVFDYKKKIPDISGKHVLLLDDIVTTGASLGNSAMLIRGLGAKQVIGVCMAIAYTDSYVPFETKPKF